MSHTTTGTILNSLLDTFDPASEHYAGVRDHFGVAKLARIDALRALPDDHQFTFDERNFIAWALARVVFKAANPGSDE
jgi:putative heme iron utilization protein